MSKKAVLTLAIVLPILVLAVIVSAQAGKPKVSGGAITKTFSQGAPCASATIALALKDGADPNAVADTVFGALQPLKGMNSATLNVSASNVVVGFCESQSNEAAIRGALAPTGLVAEAPAAPAAPAE